MKYCKRCDRTLSLDCFHNDKKTNDKLAFYCKECSSEYGRKYRSTTAGIYSNIKGRTTYSAKHNGKKSPRGYSYGKTEFNVPKEDFIKWYDNEPKTCVYCDIHEDNLRSYGDKFNEKTVRLTVECEDNERGYEIDNMLLACLRCNSIKGDIFSFEEMRDIAQKYIKPKWKAKVGEQR